MAIFNKVKPEFERLPLKKLFIVAFFVSISVILVTLISQVILPPQIPLYFGLPQTSAQLVRPILLILPSLISILITIMNTVISIKISDSYIKKTLAFTSIAVSILSTIATIKIVFLVSII